MGCRRGAAGYPRSGTCWPKRRSHHAVNCASEIAVQTAAPGGINSLPVGARAVHLSIRENREIARMKYIPGLFARAVEADKPQRAAARMSVDPVGEHTLIRRTELPRPRQYAAAVDPNWKIERGAIFERQRLRRKLGAAVQRNGRARRKIHSDALAGNAHR